ncbi:MAG: ATP-binding protein [Anaerolineales bacterium]
MSFQTNISKAAFDSSGLRQMVSQLARLCEISVTLNSTLEPTPLLQFILGTATEVLGCEAASIMLYNEQRGELLFTASTNFPEKLAQIPVPLEGSIAGTIFRENRPLLINDVEKDPRHFSQVGEKIDFQPRSLLGVPMSIRDRVIGVIEALNKRQKQFTQQDAYLLAIIASQAAVAISNARLHRALQNAYDELSRVDKIKSNFMAIASHELRTPLGVILGYATFLKEDAQGKLSEHANMVLNSALKLRSLVEEMTNMNLLQIGSLDLQMYPTPIQKVISRAYDEIASTANAKGQKVTLDIPKEPVTVNAETSKLELVFINLLNNAVRFTPVGGSMIVHTFARGREVWTKVIDNGPSIPPSELKNIFQEFYQIDDHLTRRYGGMGLGLAIAKGIVELHDGRIWAESEGGGKGATIVVVLPKSP